MSKYLVLVIYEYSVDAINTEDAFGTVPIATRLKYLNADGTTEIINSEGKVVLKAKLVTKTGVASSKEVSHDVKTDTGQAALVV